MKILPASRKLVHSAIDYMFESLSLSQISHEALTTLDRNVLNGDVPDEDVSWLLAILRVYRDSLRELSHDKRGGIQPRQEMTLVEALIKRIVEYQEGA